MKMKNSILFVTIIFGAFFVNAQEKGTSQINVGYGMASTPEIIDAFTGILSYPASLGIISASNLKSTGAMHINYKFAIENKWILGVTTGFSDTTQDISVNNAVIGEQKYRALTFAIESDYRYISNPSFQIYSGLGAGITINKGEFEPNSTKETSIHDNSSYFNYKVTALGLRVGKKLAGFLELGFGYKGIVSAGISYQF